jgi:hypothetical protein
MMVILFQRALRFRVPQRRLQEQRRQLLLLLLLWLFSDDVQGLLRGQGRVQAKPEHLRERDVHQHQGVVQV